MVAVVALTAAVPGGQERPDGPNRFPLAGLWQWLTTRPAWSFDPPSTPVQPRGGPVGGPHAVPAEQTRANGGNGRPPGAVSGTLPEHRLSERADRPEAGSGRAAAGFDAATSRRVQDGSSATVDVFENADGSVTRRIYAQPVNFLAADGTWQPIETRLVRDRDGRLRTAAGEVRVRFAAASTAEWGAGSEGAPDTVGELVSVVLPSGNSVAYGLSGAAAVQPTLSGSKATYAEILPHTDVELVALPGGVKETLVLKSVDAANEWVFPMRLGGLTPRLEGDGSISLRDDAGVTVLVIPAGTMYDSKVDAAGERPVSSAVRYELITVEGGPALRVVADAGWLRDPARAFPVMVDPTILAGGNASTYAQKEVGGPCCTNNNSGETILKTGYHSSGPWQTQSFVKFDGFSSAYLGHKISSANFWAHVVWVGACSGSHLRLYDVDAWTPSGITNWNNRPALWAQAGSWWGEPNNDNCVQNTSENPEVGQWWGGPLNADGLAMLNRWTTGGVNNGVAVVSDLDANNANWKKIASVYTTRPPHFEITYTPNDIPQVEALYPPHGYGSPTLTPELIVAASDLDRSPKPLTYRFQVFASDGVTVVADSGTTPVASHSWVVPPGSLEWGKTYVWGAVAFDGAAVSAPYPAHILVTQVPQALITSGLAQNSSAHGFEPTVGNYTSQVTDANISTVGPALAVQRSYNSRDPRTGSAFGAGWSSLIDSRLTRSGTTATITYPSGQDVAFGLKADGSYAPRHPVAFRAPSSR
jgi:large repetitive protein